MSAEDSETSVVDSVAVQEAVAEKFHDSPEEHPPTRLFNRHRSVHQILGGGKHADILLWRDKFMSAGILGGFTVAYLLFEHSGYTLLKIIANLLLVCFAVLFVWSNAAVFLNRSPPPLPNFQISEEAATSLALALRVEINKVMATGHDIALGRDFKTFLKVVAVLWGLSVVGGWFHFLTLVYLCFVLAHTIPVIYEKYEDQIESYAKIAFEEAHKQYKKADATLLSKFPWFASKVKKI